jgi:hypothetical protein
MPEKPWFKKYGEEIVVGLIVCAIWAVMAYMFGKDNPLARPIFYGSIPAILVVIAYLLFRLTRRIPKPKTVATLRNIEGYVRTWLDNQKVTTKNDPHPDCHFRLRLTMDSGCSMTVLRSKTEYEEYVQVICDLGMRGDDKKVLELFTDQEKGQIMLDIKTELARAKVGYFGLVDPPENFQLFRRLPVYPTFNEHTLMYMLGDVEAARNLVLLMFMKAKMNQPAIATPQVQTQPQPQPQLAPETAKS